MTLPTSPNPISLQDIQNEFGGSNPISLNEYYAGGGLVASGTVGFPSGNQTAIPASGAIRLGNFHGANKVEYTLNATLLPAVETQYSYFGYDVAISGNGDRLLVSQPNFETGIGRVHIYGRSGETWSLEKTLTGGSRNQSNGQGSEFGKSVAINSTGDRIVIGEPLGQPPNLPWGSGLAYYYKKLVGNDWLLISIPKTPGQGNDDGRWGEGLSINTNFSNVRSLINVGVTNASNWSGSYVASRNAADDAWNANVELNGNIGGAFNPRFGLSSAFSGNGQCLLVGGPLTNLVSGGSQRGDAVLWLTDSTLSYGSDRLGQRIVHPNSPADGDRFGWDVAMDYTGANILISAPGKDNSAGAVYFFTRSGNLVTYRQKIVAPTRISNATFGTAIWLSSDGLTAFISHPGELTSSVPAGRGKVYMYKRSGNTWSLFTSFFPPTTTQHTDFGKSISVSDDLKWVIIGADRIFDRFTYGLAYIFVDK
jgi:hypothetical protein